RAASRCIVAEWDLNPHLRKVGAGFGLSCQLVAITLNSLAFAGKERIKERDLTAPGGNSTI
ncbi:MAG TPA: hypothetical protein DDW76_08390, partial [Cyanobacteria bacterium UBA11369]|nr:hypothetical protein [Cyanobacteria bacterium UBA11369]